MKSLSGAIVVLAGVACLIASGFASRNVDLLWPIGFVLTTLGVVVWLASLILPYLRWRNGILVIERRSARQSDADDRPRHHPPSIRSQGEA